MNATLSYLHRRLAIVAIALLTLLALLGASPRDARIIYQRCSHATTIGTILAPGALNIDPYAVGQSPHRSSPRSVAVGER